ncbi:MAG: diguanylate cyclase [Thauera sp.]|uniref:MASE3 domain-containing protein n=1 Tax=Thauera sp. TaxID=1905334 RepID=UPI00261DEAE6|nr:MASE3 domain-containing protein [Thauera sp.]MCP5224390.1 diguanylate cyclase [Thauera sp.]
MAYFHPIHAHSARRSLGLLAIGLAGLIALWWVPTPPGVAGLAHYLPLHMALETLAIVAAVLVFAVAWLTPERSTAVGMRILACCFLGVAVLDFSHMLSYQGMPDFVTPSSPEKAIDFWFAARLLAATGMLLAALLPWRGCRGVTPGLVLLAVGAYVGLAHALFLLRPEWAPRTFIAGEGLTAFKVGVEIALTLAFAASAAVLAWRMRKPCAFDAPALLGAAGWMALSELFFTMYADVTDVYNLAGHLYKIGAHYLLFRALVVDGIRAPYAALERSRTELAENSSRLTDEHRRLESILAGTRAGTWEWNVQTGETIFNARWAEMLGYRLEELEPISIDTWRRFAHPDDLADSDAAIHRHLRGETPYYEHESRMRHRAGHWIRVQDRGALRTLTDKGEPEWMFGTHIDVSDRHRAEQERGEALNRLRQLSDSVPGVLFECRVEADGRMVFPYVGRQVDELIGCRAEDVVDDATAFYARLHPDDRAQVIEEVRRAKDALQDWSASFRVLHPVHGERRIRGEARCQAQPDGAGEWFGYLQDETEAHRNQEWLRLSARVFDASQEGILVTDAEVRIVDANPAMEALTGYARDALLGRNPSVLRSGRHDAAFFAAMYTKLQHDGRWQGEMWNRHRSGEIYVVKVSISTVRDESGRIEHYVAVFTDISKLMAQRDHFSSLANFDALTGLPNRRLLEDRLHQAVGNARRGKHLVVCMLDLDGFKAVNDSAGHAEGDRLLIELAQRMQHILRAGETLARLGGDEFVLLLVDGDFRPALERVLEVARAPVALCGGGFARVTASIGASAYRHGVEDGAQLLREADHALYRAKRAGRSRWVMFAPEDAAGSETPPA